MGWQLQSVPELDDDQFERWCVLLESRIGMQVAPHQRSFLQIQIARRVRELKFTGFDEYFDYIQKGIPGLMEWRQLIDRLVVRETSFFREPDSLEFVCSELRRRMAERSLEGGFDVWSLGCATGEEPYSLAMELNNCFEASGLAPQFSITASDVSQQALQQAKEAVYSSRKLEKISQENIQRYFSEIEPGFWQVDSGLQQRICFTAINLLDLAKVPMVPMDIIYCQNVLIYFRRWRRREILDELVTRLKPGGILVIGMGELVDWSSSLVTRVADNRVQAYLRCE
ncbi:MAG: type 4 fimbrial methyltransferase PilK [Candidatus Pelagadaptatus aseana]|uniref:CheR family methyltransferase n=1 Tax=Candidatus Pelagadaptatus aseana TaxID=3120508 RepID=UPI0039B3339A